MSSIKINGSGSGSLRITGVGSAVVKIAPPAGGFDPGSLGGLKAWYNAGALTGLTNGEVIPTWADGSEFGNTLTFLRLQGFGDAVKYVASDALLNNQPSAEFAGNGCMDLPYTSGNTFPHDGDFTLYSVGYSSEGTYACLGGGDYPASYPMLGFVNSSNTTYANNDGSSAASKGVAPNTPSIFSYGYTAGSTIASNLFYVNGSNAGVTQYPGGSPGYYGDTSLSTYNGGINQGLRIGARYATSPLLLVGHVAEVLLYLGKHNDADRDTVTAYLATKYGISI